MASAPSASSLRTKRYILAALAAIFAATTITIVVSTILSPAEINFSIINNSYSSSTAGLRLVLTLSANNTSHRAGVQYSNATTLAYLQYTDDESNEHKVSADNITMPQSQSPGSMINIAVSAVIPNNIWHRDFTGRNGTSQATLVKLLMILHVRFKVGPAYTLRHIIRLLCDPKDYFSGTHLSSPVNCSAA